MPGKSLNYLLLTRQVSFMDSGNRLLLTYSSSGSASNHLI